MNEEFTCNAQTTILESALHHAVNIPHNCGEGFCKRCECRVISGEYASNDNAETNDPKTALACSIKPKSNLIITFNESGLMTKTSVLSIQKLSTSVVEIEIQCHEDFDFGNGQYVLLSHKEGLVGKPYSIVTPRNEYTQSVKFHISTRGNSEFVSWIKQACVKGIDIYMSSANGSFGITDSDIARIDSRVYLSSGSGAGVLYGLAASNTETKTYYAGVQDRSGVCYYKDNFSLIHNAESLEDILFQKETNKFDFGSISTMFSGIDKNKTEFYLCGSKNFIDETTAYLNTQGIQQAQIYSEGF